MSTQRTESREERINEALRELGRRVRELRRDLDQLLTALNISTRSDDGPFRQGEPQQT